MVLQRLFRPSPARQAGEALFAAVTRQARQPALYADLGAPDTPVGRFEIYSLHVVLVLNRLKGLGGEAGEVSQALFDSYVRSLDDALRDLGVGDLSVGKKMRKLGEAFYGRAKAYDSALNGDREGLTGLVERTVFAEAPGGDVAGLVDYIERAKAALAGQSVESVLACDLAWPGVRP